MRSTVDAAARERCERECARLCVDFAWAVDRHETEAFLALFTADGRFERPGMVCDGTAAIRRFLESRPQDRVTRHLVTNIRIVMVDSDRATGNSSASMYQAHRSSDASGGTPSPLPIGEPLVVDYLDDYRLVDGLWKFERRRTTIVFGT